MKTAIVAFFTESVPTAVLKNCVRTYSKGRDRLFHTYSVLSGRSSVSRSKSQNKGSTSPAVDTHLVRESCLAPAAPQQRSVPAPPSVYDQPLSLIVAAGRWAL